MKEPSRGQESSRDVTEVDAGGAEETQYHRASRLVGAATSMRIASTAVIATAGLATTVLAVRLLGQSRYGTLAFALSLVGLATGASRLGLGASTIRTVAAHGEDEHEALASTIRGTFTVLAVAGLIAAVGIAVVLSSGGSIPPSERLALIVCLGIFMVGRNLSTANFWIAVGLGRVTSMEVGNLTIAVALVTTLALLTVLEQSHLALVVGAYALAGIAGSIASLVSLRRLTRKLKSALRISMRAGRETVRIAAPYAMSAVTALIIAQFDVFVLGVTGTRAEVGLYEPTLRVAERLLNLVPFLFLTGFVPASTRLFRGGSQDEFRLLYRTVSATAFVLAAPAVVLLAAFPQLTLSTLFGEAFVVNRGIAWILLSGYVTNLIFGFNGGALAATGHRRTIVTSYGIALIVMAMTAILLIPPFGPLGAAIATATSYVVLNLAVSTALYRITGAHIFSLPIIGIVLTSALPIAGTMLIGKNVSSFAVAVLIVLASWVVWLGLLILLGWLRWSDLAVFLPRRGRSPSS